MFSFRQTRISRDLNIRFLTPLLRSPQTENIRSTNATLCPQLSQCLSLPKGKWFHIIFLALWKFLQLSGYLQLLEIYWNLKIHLEISLNLYGPPGNFYPRDAMLTRVITIATCLCLSRAGIVSKRRKVVSWFLHYLVATSPKTLVFWRQISSPNSKGFPPIRCLKQGWGGKIQRFSSFKHEYLENGSRYGQRYY